MANPIRFRPLDGIPDADQRGAGTFEFDDGTSMVAEDPELASLVKSYQDTLPELQNLQAGLDAVPDQRLASSSPADDPIGAVFGNDPFGDSALSATDAGGAAASEFLGGADEYKPIARGYIPGANAANAPPPVAAAQNAPEMPVAASAPPEMGDAQKAAELHRMAGDQALRGTYVPGQTAGYKPAQRSGALDPEVAARQTEQRGASNAEMLDATQQARMAEAESLRASAMQEAMRLTVQREEQQRLQREAEAKRKRLLDERRAVNDAGIDTSFAQGDGFRQVMAVMGAALLGAVGSDAGLRMIESNIDRHVRKEMQVRGSRLQALAEEIGSEEQVVSAAKARIYELMEKQAGVTQKTLKAAEIENNTPAIIAELKRRQLESDQAFERESLGKTTEVFQQGRRGGFSGPNLDAAAKHYEKAGELGGGEAADPTGSDLRPDARKDYVARMQGLSDAEHSLNEIDRNIGIKRDAAGNVVNAKELGNVEGAGFFGGRTPDELSSTKGSALSRERRRLVQAQVKAMSGAAATDVEREEYGKNIPLVDEKDLVNSTTEERRKWQKAYSDAVTLYGRARVDAFLQRKRGTQAGINRGRGREPGVESAEGQMLEIDE